MASRPADRPRLATSDADEPRPAASAADIELDLLLIGVRAKYGHDFRHYSRSSLARRLARGLERLGYASLSELQGDVLRSEVAFLRLLPYLTVSTTELFRDPDFFAAFRRDVIPQLLAHPSVKLWVAGCSTGEEVLSYCILLEEAGLLSRARVYATDISPLSLETAARAVYPLRDVVARATSYRQSGGVRSLDAHFTVEHRRARFDPRLLANVVFADHSLATDAAFSEVHVVSCRNVLIYFDHDLQERALGVMTESLRRGGFLCLGNRETLQLSRHASAFDPLVREQRIYRKR